MNEPTEVPDPDEVRPAGRFRVYLGAAAGVLAAGAWSGGIAVWSGDQRVEIPETFGVRGHLLGYQLESGSLGPLLRHGHTYVMQRSNGFTIAGSNEERIEFDDHVDPVLSRELHARAAEFWPTLGNHTPTESWIGFRPATEDRYLAALLSQV